MQTSKTGLFGGSPDAKATNPFEDFPSSESWRVITDGWQHIFGPQNFRAEYYKGMGDAFSFIINTPPDQITVEALVNLWEMAFKSEKTYAKFKQKCPNAVRDKINAHFSIGFTPNSNGLAVSQQGLDEFIDELIANNLQWRIFFARAGIDPQFRQQLIKFCIDDVDEKGYFNPEDYQKDKAQIKKVLREKFFDPKVDVVLIALSWDRKYIEGFMRLYFKMFNESMAEAKEDKDKIGAIVKFIQRLHLLHPFLDGNGRVLIFLLQNLLLKKHLNCMAFTFTPAHFAGFSKAELIEEVQRGIAEFAKYKITKARLFLEKIGFAGDEKDYSAKLEANLAGEQLIAMAQINELFLRVKFGKIRPPGEGKDAILKILKDLYMKKLSELAAQPPQNAQDKIKDKGAFLSIIELHKIRLEFQEQEIHEKIDQYFKQQPAPKPDNKKSGFTPPPA